MTTATLTVVTPPGADDIRRAVSDDQFYADTLASLGRDSIEGARFIADVDAAARQSKPLNYTETRVLAFARRVYRTPGAREQAVRDEFGFGATRYHQILGALLDRPEALAADPELVNRLRRLRDMRRTQRAARTPATTGRAAA